MPTTTSGLSAINLATSARRSFSKRGRCLITSAKPNRESSRMSNQESSPWACMREPPMPTKLASGKRRRSAAIRSPPSWSPDSSPARMAMTGEPVVRVGAMSLPRERTLATVEEGEHFAHVLAFLRLHFQLLARFGQRQTGHEQRAIGPLDGADAGGVEAAALQALAVDAAWAAAGLIGHHHEGRDVRAHQAAHADERMRAHLAELVHARVTGEDRPVADLRMPGERRVVGEHDMVAHLAVVRDMHVGQEPVVVADTRDTAAVTGATVDRDELTDEIAIADDDFGALALPFLVLRRTTDGRELRDAVVASDHGRTLDHHVRTDGRALADDHVGTD